MSGSPSRLENSLNSVEDGLLSSGDLDTSIKFLDQKARQAIQCLAICCLAVAASPSSIRASDRDQEQLDLMLLSLNAKPFAESTSLEDSLLKPAALPTAAQLVMHVSKMTVSVLAAQAIIHAALYSQVRFPAELHQLWRLSSLATSQVAHLDLLAASLSVTLAKTLAPQFSTACPLVPPGDTVPDSTPVPSPAPPASAAAAPAVSPSEPFAPSPQAFFTRTSSDIPHFHVGPSQPLSRLHSFVAASGRLLSLVIREQPLPLPLVAADPPRWAPFVIELISGCPDLPTSFSSVRCCMTISAPAYPPLPCDTASSDVAPPSKRRDRASSLMTQSVLLGSVPLDQNRRATFSSLAGDIVKHLVQLGWPHTFPGGVTAASAGAQAPSPVAPAKSPPAAATPAPTTAPAVTTAIGGGGGPTLAPVAAAPPQPALATAADVMPAATAERSAVPPPVVQLQLAFSVDLSFDGHVTETLTANSWTIPLVWPGPGDWVAPAGAALWQLASSLAQAMRPKGTPKISGNLPAVPWAIAANLLQLFFYEVPVPSPTPTGVRLRPLSLDDVEYLKLRFVSRDQSLPQAHFMGGEGSLWHWFGRTLSTLYSDPGLLALWNQGLLFGFITRSTAEEHLGVKSKLAPAGSFLVRCSERNPGQWVIVYTTITTVAGKASAQLQILHFIQQPTSPPLLSLIKNTNLFATIIQVQGQAGQTRFNYCDKDPVIDDLCELMINTFNKALSNSPEKERLCEPDKALLGSTTTPACACALECTCKSRTDGSTCRKTIAGNSDPTPLVDRAPYTLALDLAELQHSIVASDEAFLTPT